MGTYATDALAPNLLAGATLNSATTSTGTAVELDWTADTTFILTLGTVTGTTPTIDVTLQGCETVGFGSNVVTLGRFGQGTTTGQTLELTTFVDAKYVRASVTVGGTTPVFTGSTLKPQPKHYMRTRLNSAAP